MNNEESFMEKIYIVDVMPLLYRGHFAFLRSPRMTVGGVNTSALFSYAMTVMQILEQRNPTHIVLVFDSKTPTFRHEAYPDYKAQRDKLPEDIAASIGMAQEFAEAMRLPTLRIDGYEADDLLGTLSRMAEERGMEAYLVSPDKDIAQLVRERVMLYRLGGRHPEIWGVKEVCDHWRIQRPEQMIDYLALAGDASDNIPGIRGIGEKGAQKLIEQYGDIEGILAAAVVENGGMKESIRAKIVAGMEDARMSRFLTTIRRDVPIEVGLDTFRVQKPDLGQMRAVCVKYEFGNIAKKLGIEISENKVGELKNEKTAGANQEKGEEEGERKVFESIATYPHEYKFVTDEESLNLLVMELRKAKLFAFDTEATSSDSREAHLVGLSFSTEEGRAWYVPYPMEDCGDEGEGGEQKLQKENEGEYLFDLFGEAVNDVAKEETKGQKSQKVGQLEFDLFTEEGGVGREEKKGEGYLAGNVIREALSPIFADETIEKTGHNVKYDCELLERNGMGVRGVCHDTMLMHFALDAADRHGLDRLAKLYLHYDPIPISTLIGEGREADPQKMGKLPGEKICDYAAEDADLALRLYKVLHSKIEEAGLKTSIEECEEPLVGVLLEMERAGVKIDTQALRDFGQELDREIGKLELGIYEKAGERFSIRSPRQLGDILFRKLVIEEKAAKTASGQYVTSEEVLQKYVGKHPIVREILEWRAAEKLKSTYVDKLPKCVSPIDGRVHTHFSQAFTETGRLASSDPNLQNIPVRTSQGKRMRSAIVARDDEHSLMSADYSQIELRIMAALSGDATMMEAFREGRDIHAETASRVYGVPISEVTTEQRSHCKMVNFGIIYGISVFGLSQRLGVTRVEAGELIQEYFKQYPGIKRFMERSIEKAREKGYAETILGRRRSLHDISSRNGSLRQSAERNAVNTPVQGSAADLIKLAMVRTHRALRKCGLRAQLILQIHDELLLEVPKTEVEKVSQLVREAMVNAYDFGVPLEVEIGVGKTWLEAH